MNVPVPATSSYTRHVNLFPALSFLFLSFLLILVFYLGVVEGHLGSLGVVAGDIWGSWCLNGGGRCALLWLIGGRFGSLGDI